LIRRESGFFAQNDEAGWDAGDPRALNALNIIHLLDPWLTRNKLLQIMNERIHHECE